MNMNDKERWLIDNMNDKETMKKINKTIDAEMKKTPDDMILKVEIVVEEEGLRLNFTRERKET